MGERLLCKQEVIGSIPFTSTSFSGAPGFERGWRKQQVSLFDIVNRRFVLGA